MGRAAFPIIGGIIGAAVVGFYTGGTGTLQGYAAGFALGSTVGGIAGSYIDPIMLQGNKIGDNNIQVAAEGGARAIMFGRACITATCIIARGNRVVMKKKTSNGKGSTGSTVNETVSWTFAIGLGEAIPGASISRIWQDESLVYDVLGDGIVSIEDNNKFAAKFRFYDGNETQLPDGDLQTFLGEDTPYFRGTAYVVFPNFDLTQTGERIPQFKFEILNGVAGIVDELNTLAWSLPNSSVHTSSQSVTLTASPTVTFQVRMKFTTDMESRKYDDGVVRLPNGSGRIITANSSHATNTAVPWSIANVYRVTIDKPAQTYYINASLDSEALQAHVQLDGGAESILDCEVAGDATITFFATDTEGASTYYPQFGSMEARITGLVPGTDSTITLSSVVSSLMERAGMTEDQFDVTALDDQVAGVCIQESVNGADAINSCVQPFFADPCEGNGVLTYVKRGAAVLRTLTIDDLTEDPDIPSRENVIEYPAKVSFFYQSPATGYATTKATSSRYSPQAKSSSEGSVTAPITFYGSDEPAQIAAKLHKIMWTEAEGSFVWTTSIKCIDLLPTTVLGLFVRGIVNRARIINTEFDGSTVKLTMVKDRQSSYTSAVTAIPLPTPTAPQPTTMSQAVLAVMDIPALSDSDDALVYYTAMSGSTSVWSGAQLQRSLDDGASWTPIGDVSTDVTMGRLTVAMTSADRAYTDTTNTITVQLFDSANDLVAYSDTTFLQEQGAIAVQLGDGTWEVMQYRDSVDGGSGLWTLSYLQRGRLDTVAGAHAVGALFVLLADAIVKNAAQTAWLGGVVKHRAISYSTSAEDATVITNTYVGRSQLEWSPASAAADYDGTYVYIHDIVPRHRFGTEVSPIASVNFQGYRVTITDSTHTVTSDLLTGSAHILSAPIVTPTGIMVAALNKITGPGGALTVTPNAVTAGSLTPVAIVNAGGGA